MIVIIKRETEMVCNGEKRKRNKERIEDSKMSTGRFEFLIRICRITYYRD